MAAAIGRAGVGGMPVHKSRAPPPSTAARETSLHAALKRG